MSSSTAKGGHFVQMLASLSLFKNPLSRHAGADRKAAPVAGEGGVGAKQGGHQLQGVQPRNGGRELPKLHETGHTRSLTSSTSSLSGGSQHAVDSNVAPSATVGGLTSAEGAAAPSAVASLQEHGEEVTGVEYGPPTDVDVELGYPAALIIKYWREKERDPARVMRYDPSATYIPHRRYMVDWISEIGEELKLQPVTIHSAISFLDQVCTTQGYDPKGWRLQAICCLSVAAKYEEAERNMPMVSEMAIAAETRLTTGMVTQGELSLARGLGWDISRVTAMHFLGYYLHQGVTFPSDECQGRALVTKVTRYMKKYVEFFCRLCPL
eukprot:TRINITY_DN25780_c0_g1_i1.p1 TRINITY_DN25780_c0_g1~~TRINITY_DN25780_c0_g1_i1.p1  ORF type:complete len:324 (+),score=57.66 TRINITY_DN25780_c0_g1_i1:53-1024(+)